MTSKRPFTQGGRITSLFGILLPPKRRQKCEKHLTIRFVLTGTVPSKKNRQRAGTNFRFLKAKAANFESVKELAEYLNENLKVYIRSSPEYIDWLPQIKPTILEQAKFWHEKYERFGLTYPLSNCSMKVYHYWPDDQERDLCNKLDTIQDALVEFGILSGDSWQKLSPVASEGGNYFQEIMYAITTVDITVRL